MKTKTEILDMLDRLDFPAKEVAIEADDFFQTDASDIIGVNVDPPPSVETFYVTFKELVASQLADEVYVRISDIEQPEDWFFSDAVYVVGKLSMMDLHRHIEHLGPTEICEGWMYGMPVNVENPKTGRNVYTIFWD